MTDASPPLDVYLRLPGPSGRLTSDAALLADPDAARALTFGGYMPGGIAFDDQLDNVVITDDLLAIHDEIVVNGPAALQAGTAVRYRLRGDPSELVLEPHGDMTSITLDDGDSLTVPTALLLEKLAEVARRFEQLRALAAGG